MSDERQIQEAIQVEASKMGNKLFKNTSGAFKDQTGRLIYFGLGNVSHQQNKHFKSSDLIGYTMITVTNDMVGLNIPVFTAIEVKNSKWKYTATDREVAQKKFLDVIANDKCVALFCNSVESYKKAIIDFLLMR